METAPNYSINVRDRVSSMLKSGRWSDCKFLVGTEHQEVVEGHKTILASSSPVFEAMFYGEMAERNRLIPIPDIQPRTFRSLLKYIYTDRIKIRSFDEACNLYYAAKKYILPNLLQKCIRSIECSINTTNVCRAYEFAILFQEKKLMNRCLKRISVKANRVLSHKSFEDVQLSTMITIFSLEHVNCTALDMFNAVERYVRTQEKHNAEKAADHEYANISTLNDIVAVNVESSPYSSEAVEESLKQGTDTESVLSPSRSKEKLNIHAAIKKIHFLTLTPQEFVEGPAQSSLLTESEVFAITMNIVSDKTNVPMPSGFSTYRKHKEPAKPIQRCCHVCGTLQHSYLI